VDEEHALDALTLAWGGEYDEISVLDSKWGAHRKDAPDDDVITGSTPDELNRKIRADWLRREPRVTKPKKDEQHPIDRKIANLGKGALEGDQDAVDAEADELPRDGSRQQDRW
jgi:hypothetical protein